MMSATETAEELSAAVTRGIENPVKKTSLIELHFGALDWVFLSASILFTAAAFIL